MQLWESSAGDRRKGVAEDGPGTIPCTGSEQGELERQVIRTAVGQRNYGR